ncbi:hypothetical protein PG301_32370 [Parageobacillus sp. G301]|nr:hypothetical protein PG301_32370 [Parageobacillus sp. G301]
MVDADFKSLRALHNGSRAGIMKEKKKFTRSVNFFFFQLSTLWRDILYYEDVSLLCRLGHGLFIN